MSIQHLEYVPYMRLILAKELNQLLGDQFPDAVREILRYRKSGA
nr:carbon starvation induced protein CsiD [Paraburkholderia phytofirmans]